MRYSFSRRHALRLPRLSLHQAVFTLLLLFSVLKTHANGVAPEPIDSKFSESLQSVFTTKSAEGCEGYITFGTPGGTIYSSQLPNPLPSAFKIEGKLVIQGWTTWSDLDVKMGNAAEIYLDPLAGFTVTGTVIEGCETMWKGVTLDHYSTIIVTGGSQINDAVNAIYVTKYCYVDLEKCTFYRNFRTLYAVSPDFSNISFDLHAAGPTVVGTGPLKPPHSQQSFWDYGSKAEAGFRFIRCNNVGGNLKVGEIGEPQCTFRDCAFGVSSYQSNLTVENCRFEEMTGGTFSGYYYGGVGVYGEYGYYHIQRCEFFRCITGVSFYKQNFVVEYNDFQRLTQALYARQSVYSAFPLIELPTARHNVVDYTVYGFVFFQNDESNPQVNNNTISRAGRDAVSIMDFAGMPNLSYIHTNTLNLSGGGWPNGVPDGSSVGVRLTTTRNPAVCRNTISHTPDGDQNICILADGSSLATITNNDLMLNPGGHPYLGAHTGIQYTMTDYSTIDCNDFTGNTYGLVVNGTCTATKVSKNTFVSELLQGMIYNSATTQQQVHTGNRWLYTTNASYPGAVNNGSDVNANTFFVDCAENSAFCPYVISPAGWFVDQNNPNGTTALCNPGGNICSVPPPFAPDGGEEEMIAKIINNRMTFTDYADASSWLASRQALSWIAVNGLTNSDKYAAYWKANANTSQGKLAQLEAEAIAWKATRAEQERQMGALWADMKALMNGTDRSEAARNLFEQKRRQLENLRNDWDADFDRLLEKWAAVNASLPEDKIFVKNQKQINALMLDLRHRNTVAFTKDEQTMLWDVANQCPLAGGPAVLQARHLISLFVKNDMRWDNDVVCSDRGQTSSVTVPETGNIRVMPNPNDGTFLIVLPADTPAEGAQALLYDMTGRLVRQQNLRSDNERFNASGEVPPGIYLLEVRDAAGKRAGLVKVSIQ